MVRLSFGDNNGDTYVVLQDSEFRPAHEVFTGGGGQLDLDYLQQHGSQSSSVSHLAR